MTCCFILFNELKSSKSSLNSFLNINISNQFPIVILLNIKLKISLFSSSFKSSSITNSLKLGKSIETLPLIGLDKNFLIVLSNNSKLFFFALILKVISCSISFIKLLDVFYQFPQN